MTEWINGSIVRALKRIPAKDLNGFDAESIQRPLEDLEESTLLTVTTFMPVVGCFDAITFKGNPTCIYMALFSTDFEVLNEMEALALAAQEEEK